MLQNNICTIDDFGPGPTMKEIEEKLITCGVAYALNEQMKNLENRHDTRLTAVEDQLKTISGKFDRLESRIEEMADTFNKKLELLTKLMTEMKIML
jgi:hypothetical protein